MGLGKSGNKIKPSGHLPAMFYMKYNQSSVKLAGCHLYFSMYLLFRHAAKNDSALQLVLGY